MTASVRTEPGLDRALAAPAPRAARGALLCLANFPANTGYAWDFIERLYAGVSTRLAPRGVETIVAFPSVSEPVRALAGSPARAVRADASLSTWRSVREVVALVRRERVRAVYLTDRPTWSFAYLALRVAGVRHVVVHDHTSGERDRPRGIRRIAKWLLARMPGINADLVVAVSDYVAARQREVSLVPPHRIARVWNSVAASQGPAATLADLEALGVPAGRPVIACTCRTVPEKGVDVLLRAFDRLVASWPASRARPVLLYLGDGPALPAVRALRESLASASDIHLPGYHPGARRLVGAADLCVVPSVWAEAFGLAVLEAMADGRAVVATRVGGIPEIVEDGVSGVLVPPGDADALAGAMRRLLDDPTLAARLGAAARVRARTQFAADDKLDRLAELLGVPFDAAEAQA
jgi:glycosyltransferase involved in cell wall biosynthesis